MSYDNLRRVELRVIFLTDVHGNFRSVSRVLDHIKADLYILAGDLIYKIFPRYSMAWRFMEAEQFLSCLRYQSAKTEALMDLAKRVCQEGPKGKHLTLAREYMALCHKAQKEMLKQYETLSSILEGYPGLLIRVLPGNYDMDLRQTPLHRWNLHLEVLEVGGLTVAGYGGAKVLTHGIPNHLQVPFREEIRGGVIVSEPLEFFRATRPQVLVVHQPPWGILDQLQGVGPTGSLGIRQYIDEGNPKVVLCGHLHSNWGVKKVGSTWCVNPSNFGNTMEANRVRRGGYFLDLGIDDRGPKWAMIRRLTRSGFEDIAYYKQEGNRIQEVILDEKGFRGLGGLVPKFTRTRAFQRIQAIRSFFLRHETPQSRSMMRELRVIYRSLENKGFDVAFDLLGSVGFGMADTNSDIDLVVYFRGLECNSDEQDVCKMPRPLSRVMEELALRGIRTEVCDVIDLDRVERAIDEEDMEDAQLNRFIFYRGFCRPVNLRLIKEVENRLLRKAYFRRMLEVSLREHLSILTSSSRHIASFHKYVSRLKAQGVILPRRVERALQRYLANK